MRHMSSSQGVTWRTKEEWDNNNNTRLMALFRGLPRWASTRKVKPIWILLKQETVSGSGIRWAICNSAPRSRQITTPAPHHSVFYRPDALPAAQPTVSKHWRQYRKNETCGWSALIVITATNSLQCSDAVSLAVRKGIQSVTMWQYLRSFLSEQMKKLLLLLHPFNSLFSRTTWVSQYQKSKTSLDLSEARDDGVLGWQWHQLDHMQTISTSLPPQPHQQIITQFLQTGCPSCRSTNSVKAPKA